MSIQFGYAAPKVILKFDDVREENFSSFKWTTDIVKAKGAKGGVGIFAQVFETEGTPCMDYVRSLCNDPTTFEVWFHGYEGSPQEFYGTSYAVQKQAFVISRFIMLSKFDYLMRTYSSHYYGGDATTVQVFNEDPYLRCWMWPAGVEAVGLRPDADILPYERPFNLEATTGVMSTFEKFVEGYNANSGREWIVLQGHPWGWDTAGRNTFSQVLDFLNSQGVTYINCWDYYKEQRGITDTTAPHPPTGVGLTRINSQTIKITWNASVDEESVVDGYKVFRNGIFIAISPDIFYTDAYTQSLPDSTRYQLSGINRANLSSAKSAPVSLSGTVDITLPTNILSVRDGTGSDMDSTKITTQLSANWDASSDPESGIAPDHSNMNDRVLQALMKVTIHNQGQKMNRYSFSGGTDAMRMLDVVWRTENRK